jgi:hypothetical protein
VAAIIKAMLSSQSGQTATASPSPSSSSPSPTSAKP